MRILLTGAGGFIGSAIRRRLDDSEVELVSIDGYLPQAHGPATQRHPGVSVVDVRDADAVRAALDGVDVVCHQAAMVGAGVTASDLPDFASNNDLATAVLLAQMSDAGVRQLVLASSMVVYGDGRYACYDHGGQVPEPRTVRHLDDGMFDPTCPVCGRPLYWEVVDESAPLVPRSGYAASKVAQEHYASAWARQTGGRVIALRYHNVYGPGMPQDTPYSGVAALFRSALERGDSPRVFEDGRQMRDFVHVDDVAASNALALAAVADGAGGSLTPYNVCSGRPITIGQVADIVAGAVDGPSPTTTGEYRLGDVRHIVASPSRAAAELGFRATISPADGLAAFATAPLRLR